MSKIMFFNPESKYAWVLPHEKPLRGLIIGLSLGLLHFIGLFIVIYQNSVSTSSVCTSPVICLLLAALSDGANGSPHAPGLGWINLAGSMGCLLANLGLVWGQCSHFTYGAARHLKWNPAESFRTKKRHFFKMQQSFYFSCFLYFS